MEADGMAALGKLGMEQHFLPKACNQQAPTSAPNLLRAKGLPN